MQCIPIYQCSDTTATILMLLTHHCGDQVDKGALADVACPRGEGDGVYEPLAAPAAVVAVVGTAHVRGIIREWRRAADGAELDVDSLLAV